LPEPTIKGGLTQEIKKELREPNCHKLSRYNIYGPIPGVDLNKPLKSGKMVYPRKAPLFRAFQERVPGDSVKLYDMAKYTQI